MYIKFLKTFPTEKATYKYIKEKPTTSLRIKNKKIKTGEDFLKCMTYFFPWSSFFVSCRKGPGILYPSPHKLQNFEEHFHKVEAIEPTLNF